MIGLLSVAFFVYTATTALAAILVDFSCTNGVAYTSAASACSNVEADGVCNFLYGPGFPQTGSNVQRPDLCFSNNGGRTLNQGNIDQAIASCPKTCGYCCLASGCNGRYPADSSTSCRAWANNGFCTNTFYTTAQKRSYCATTCRIC